MAKYYPICGRARRLTTSRVRRMLPSGGPPPPQAQDSTDPRRPYPTSPSSGEEDAWLDDRRDEGADGHDSASDEDSSELDLRRSMSMSSGGFSELSADREDVSGLPEPDEADVTALSLRLLLWRSELDREGARRYLIRSSVVDLYKAWCDQHEADCVACAQETMSGGFHTSRPWLPELWPMDDCYPSIEVAGTAGAAAYTL